MQENVASKLNSVQQKIISMNHCILLYYMNQPEVCRKQCEKLAEMWPESWPTIATLQALLLCREGKLTEAVDMLKNYAEKQPENKLYYQLTAAHLLLTEVLLHFFQIGFVVIFTNFLQDDKKSACDILHETGENSYKPAIVGALISLHMSLGDKDGAAKVFEDTVAWYRSQKVINHYLIN